MNFHGSEWDEPCDERPLDCLGLVMPINVQAYLACLQAVTGAFIAENPFRSLIERHLGFLRRALPGTSG